VVRLLVQEGELSADKVRETDSWTIRIPEGVREVIGRRLNRLSQRCNEALTVASIVGREFTLAQLRPLVEEVTEDRLFEVLEEALASRVIEELPQSVGRYQFTHALIQETLAEELSITRRVRLHARIAETLEDLYGDDAEPHAAELAHHFAGGSTVLGTEKLVHYSLVAGERALAAYAWEEALSHFQRGLRAKGVPLEGTDPAVDPEAADLLFGLGKAQAATFERHYLAQAVSSMTRTFEYHAGAGDFDRAVSVAEYPFDPYPGMRTGVAHLLSRALELIPPESLQAGHLLSRLVRVLAIEEGEFEAAQEAFDTAIAIARREGDASLEMQTLANAAQSEFQQLRFRQSLEMSAQSIQLAPRAGEYRAEALAHYVASMDQMALGDPAAARGHASAVLPLAEQLRDRYFSSSGTYMIGDLSAVVGDWDAARSFSDDALAIAPMDPRNLGRRVMWEYEVGDFARGEAFLERLLEAMRATSQEGSVIYATVASVLPAIFRLTGVVDRLSVAEQAAHAVISSPSATPMISQLARTGLALLAIERGDMSAAGEQYTALGSSRGSRTPAGTSTGDRLLGLLAQTMGNLDQAAAHFEDALAFCRKAGYRPELAWTCCDYADMLRQRASTVAGRGGSRTAPTDDDRAKAMALLEESLAISSELGMRPLMERVLARREILEA